MPSPRKHLARRWHGPNGLMIRCKCGEYATVTGTVREQEDAHRAHRVAMGETVRPRTPNRLERAEAAVAAVQTVLDEYEGTDWACTTPVGRIRDALAETKGSAR